MRFLILLCCFLLASAVSAKDLKVGLVDLKKLFSEYPGTQQANSKFKKMAEKKQKELSEPEEELTDLQRQLEGSSSVLSAKQRERKATEYKKKLQEYAQLKGQMQNELAAKEAEITQTILDEIKAIVSEVAKSQDVDLVLDSEKTVYAKGGVDLTEAVLKNYKKMETDSAENSDSKKK
jgi:outer membrane protein